MRGPNLICCFVSRSRQGNLSRRRCRSQSSPAILSSTMDCVLAELDLGRSWRFLENSARTLIEMKSSGGLCPRSKDVERQMREAMRGNSTHDPTSSKNCCQIQRDPRMPHRCSTRVQPAGRPGSADGRRICRRGGTTLPTTDRSELEIWDASCPPSGGITWRRSAGRHQRGGFMTDTPIHVYMQRIHLAVWQSESESNWIGFVEPGPTQIGVHADGFWRCWETDPPPRRGGEGNENGDIEVVRTEDLRVRISERGTKSITTVPRRSDK